MSQDVRNCCLQLNSDKVSERKKGSEQLKYLLNNASEVAALDSRSRDGFSWDQVFNCSKLYFQKEAKRLEDEERKKQDPSQTVLSNRENLKRHAVTVPKLVLRKSSLKVPRISCKNVIDMVLPVLSKRNPYLLENYAGDFIQISIKYVFHFPQYYLSVQADQWKDLLKLLIWLYENDVRNTSKATVIDALERVVDCCKMRGIQDGVFVPSLVLRRMPQFLSNIMKSNSYLSQSALQSSLLQLLLTFTKTMASEWRFILCRIGEDTLDSVLGFWENVPSDRQTSLMEYLNLQIMIHHPQKDGLFHENSGYVNDSGIWQRGLHRLYQLIYDHLQQLAVKRKYASLSNSIDEHNANPQLIALAARLCHKLYHDTPGYGILDITQTGVQSTSSQGNKSNKRRKIEIGLPPLVNMLREEGTLSHSIPWYQILFELLTSYKLFFDQEKCSLLLDLFTYVLAECTLVTVQYHVIRCLEALAQQFDRVFPEDATKDELRIGKWSPIWDMTLRLVSGKQSQKEGLKLLETLMKVSLVLPNTSVFKLFYQGHVNMNDEALTTLKVLLSKVSLPRSFKTESALLFGHQVKDARESLLQVLLPSHSEGPLTALEAPSILGQVLLILRHRDSRLAQDEFDFTMDREPLIGSSPPQDNLKQIEDVFIMSTFSCSIPKQQKFPDKELRKNRQSKELKILDREEKKIIDRVFMVLNKVMEIEDRENISTEQLNSLVQALELLLILCLHVSDQRLIQLVQQALNMLALGVQKLHRESEMSRWNILLHVFKKLHYFYFQAKTWARYCTEKRLEGYSAQLALYCASTPASLLNVVVEMVKARKDQVLNNAQLGTSHNESMRRDRSSRGFSPDSDDEFNSEATMDISRFQEMEEDDDNEGFSTNLSKVNCKLGDMNVYCHQDQCLVMALHWMTLACEETSEGDESSPLEDVIAIMIDISVSPTSLELIDVAMSLHLSHALFCGKHDYNNVCDSLEILSNIGKKYSEDPRVASFIIEVLKDLILVNGSFLNETHRTSVLKLSKGVLCMQLRGNYCQCMDEAVFALNTELVKLDPKREWSKYALEGHDRCGEMYSLLSSPSHMLRIMATQCIYLLFVQNDSTLLDSGHQDRMFQSVYQIGLESLTIQGSVPDDFKSDEGNTRVATLLLSLGIIAVNSAYLETNSLFALCLAISEKNIEATLVSKVVSRVAASANTSLRLYMRHHLPYLAAEWILHKKDMRDFPVCLLECTSSKSFLEQNMDLLLPVLFEHDALEPLEALGSDDGHDVNDLWIQNFPNLMARIFPYIADEKYSQDNQIEIAKIQSAKRRYKFLEKALGKQNFSVLISRQIGDIALCIVKLVHEPSIRGEEELVITPSPPHFPLTLIQYTLKFIGQVFENSTLASVLRGKGSQLHKVMVGVLEYLARTSTPHDARRALSAVSAVVDILLLQSDGELGDAASHTVQILVHTLTFYISKLCDMATYLADYNNEILWKVCSYSLENYPQTLTDVLPILISRLLPFTKNSSKMLKSAYRVLELVLKDEHQEVQSVIIHLPPLPDDEDFACLGSLREYHQQLVEGSLGSPALYDKVETFLSHMSDYTDPHVLTYVGKEIDKSRRDIQALYKKLNINEESVGHQLTYYLVSMATSGKETISIEASKCLGELGPVPLGSPVFYIKDKNPSRIQLLESLDIKIISQLIAILVSYLTSEHIDVVEASSCALYKILATEDGHTAAQELEEPVLKALYPFMPRYKSKAASSNHAGVDATAYKQIVEDSEKWFSHNSFEEWISDLTSLLVEAGCGSEIISSVLPVCTIKPELCSFLLPIAIHMALRTDRINRREVLSKQFLVFFQRHVREMAGGYDSPHQQGAMSICLDKTALQVLLKVIDYLRAQTPVTSFSNSRCCTPWERNLWLKVNYLEVAQAAYYCGAYFSALLFLEIHCEILLTEADNKEHKNVVNRQTSRLQRVSFHNDSPKLQMLLLKVYSSLGDSDGVEGCGGGSKLLDPTARAIRSKHRGRWMKTLEIHDASTSTMGMIDALKDLRFFNTLSTVLNGSSLKPSQELSEIQWESAWRLSQWDSENVIENWEESGDTRYKNKMTFHQNLFYALQSLHHQDVIAVKQNVRQARLRVIEDLKLNQVESCSSVYPILSQLQILSEVETAAKCLNANNSRSEFIGSLEELEKYWILRDKSSDVCYTYMEPVITARTSTLRALSSSHEQRNVNEILHSTLLKKCVLARKCQILGSNTGCEMALVSAATLDVAQCLQWRTRLEEAEVAKCQGDIRHATRVLDFLSEEMQKVELRDEQEILFCEVLNLYGCALMDSRAKPPQVVIKEYLNKAVDFLEKRKEPGSREVLENSYHKLAVYGDKLYREVRQYLESDTIQSKKDNIKRSEEEFVRVQNLLQISVVEENEKKELTKKFTILKKNISIDQNVLRDLEKEQEEYIYLSLHNYLKCLLVTHDHDLHMYRAVALWMENSDKSDINKLLNLYGAKIKSCKFVPLLYQLVARLTCQTDQTQGFSVTLLNILKRVCMEHPHHSLPVVMALAHAHADDAFLKDASNSRKRSQQTQVIEEDRVQAAKLLISRLKKTSLSSHVSELERVCLAYLALANLSDKKDKHSAGEKVKIPNSQPLVNLGNIEYTSALTRPIVLQPSGRYDPPLISSWENACTFVGGLNAPKRLTVRTSDGLSQFELLKGKDDIRQDAVMEQVFGIVNELLAKNQNTNERSLSVRTYQVVPLSQRSGLIQWCDNTQPFGEYLIGRDKKSGAHKLYYPKDYSASMCRQKMHEAKSQSLEMRYKVFEDVLDHFHPVFRHFFLEHYTSPHEWYKRRLAYTRSVATNSIVGYILGLGDRHIENILLDKSTAELIHIDLGIAFDFGKILPTPETVPFRLTQDVVDGLGVMGVEGPLRQCCEATLGVLRSSAEVLVTVVEVLRHDPLYQWTLSPQQVARLQADGDEDDQGVGINSASMADRVVLRVQQKLAGFEDGFARSVSEQVTVLIQQATNNANLSRLFSGWQPYC